ncbi:MAG TPA: hypothetical protein VKV23_05290 [Acidimicrobiales bacterium]|nr:hypothetical protein [Acidimicrobiales bacterium]
MDRLAALLEQLPVPEVARVLRRAIVWSLALGVVALVLGALLGHALVGLGAVLGLGLGLGNVRLVLVSLRRVGERAPARPKRALAARTLYRLAATTALVIGLSALSVPLGLGSAIGIALFYVALLANLVRSLLQHGTRGLAA